MGALLSALLAPLVSCVEEPAGTMDSGLADSAAPDVAPLPDAGPPPIELSTRAPELHDMCALPFFKLPFDGMTEFMGSFSFWGTRAAWSQRVQGNLSSIHVMELDTCLERELVQRELSSVDLWKNHLVWRDSTFSSEGAPYHGGDIVLADLSSYRARWITFGPANDHYPQVNTTHVVFNRDTTRQEVSPMELWLEDLSSGDRTLIEEANVMAVSTDLGASRLAYTGYHAGGWGKDVYYYDLSTGETVYLEETKEDFQHQAEVRGDYLIWMESAWYAEPPYRLIAHRLSSQDMLVVAEDEWTEPSAGLHRGILAYNSTVRSGRAGFRDSDIVVHDLASGVSRVLTRDTGSLRSIRLHLPYLILGHILYPDLASPPFDLYVADLEALGVIDESGHVVAGDPVLDQPPLPESR